MPARDRPIKERINTGNWKAAMGAKYFSHRTGKSLDSLSLEDDKAGRDFINLPSGKTIQAKARDSGQDFIYESDKFISDGTTFIRKPGRDAAGDADFYMIIPRRKRQFRGSRVISVERHRLEITTGEAIKAMAAQVFQEWGKEITDEMIRRWWEHGKKGLFVYTANNGVSVWFGVDAGPDTPPYGKFIVYSPREAIEEAGYKVLVIEAREGEDIFDESTWLPS